MSNKQSTSQYSKYYHNDIKKQLGIDESRTASQKILDKVIKVDRRADFYTHNQLNANQLNSQPKKKVKTNNESSQNQKPISNLDVLESKLFKNIQNQQNVTRLLKCLTILKKCLNQEAFINDPQINFNQNWKIYTQKLINQITERNYCSSQSFVVMQNIGDCIQILQKTFDLEPNQNKQQGEVDKLLRQLPAMLNQQQVYTVFSRLFTDDSFIFNINIAKIKNYIFSQFDQVLNPLKGDKASAFRVLNKLVSMPVKFEWVHLSLSNFFKEFNNRGYQNQFETDEQRKNYLRKFNQFLNKRPKGSVDSGSYSIMGNPKNNTGLKTVYVQNVNGESSDKWVSKQ